MAPKTKNDRSDTQRRDPSPPPRSTPPLRRSEPGLNSRQLTYTAIGASLVLAILVIAFLAAWWANGNRLNKRTANHAGGDGMEPASVDDAVAAVGATNASGDVGSDAGGNDEATEVRQEADGRDTSNSTDSNTESNGAAKRADSIDGDSSDSPDPGAANTTDKGDVEKDTEDESARDFDDRKRVEALQSFNTLGAPAGSDARNPIEESLKGREGSAKADLLARYGGGEDTEAAVHFALEWLARNQLKDGSWSLQGPFSGGGAIDSPVAATAMALLAFQGAGNTPANGDFKAHVRRGVQALFKMQARGGDFSKIAGRQSGQLYAQAQATMAVCELYGMTKSRSFRTHAQRAINYAVEIQSPQGGWRYQPGTDTDTSVTGWFVMALQSALMAELDVPRESLQRVDAYLDTVASSDESRYRYLPSGRGASHTMTAEALLCRQYLGWRRSDNRLVEGVKYLDTIPLNWSRRNVYCWYYATQVMHSMEGNTWTRWNNGLKPVLLENQEARGPESGSWPTGGDKYGPSAGRLYVTCLCVWMLETYYRHLPIYSFRVY